MATLHPADEETRAVMESVIDEFFGRSIRPCEPSLNIALLFGHDLAKGGFPVSVMVKATNEEERATAGPDGYDARIILDFDDWTRRLPRARRAVLADALYALEPQGQMVHPPNETPYFQCKTDTHNRPLLKIKKADYRATGYYQVAEWFGPDSPEYRAYKAIGERLYDIALGFVPAPRDPAERPPVTHGATTPTGPAAATFAEREANTIRHAFELAKDLGPEPPAKLDTDAIINAGLAEIGAAMGEIDHEAARLAELDPPDLADRKALWWALPTTGLECPRSILRKLWTSKGIATVGQLADAVDGSVSSAVVTLHRLAGLTEPEADQLMGALALAEQAFGDGVEAAAGSLAAEPLAADSEAEAQARAREELDAETFGRSIPDDDTSELTAGLEEAPETVEETPDGGPAVEVRFKAYDVRKESAKPLGSFWATSVPDAWSKAKMVWGDRVPSEHMALEGVGDVARKMLEMAKGATAHADEEGPAKPTKKAKAKAAPEADPLEDRFIIYLGQYANCWILAPTLAEAIGYAKERFPKATTLHVKADVDGLSLDKVPFLADITTPKPPPAGFVGSDVKEVARCNKCNELRPMTVMPCPTCEGPEYTIIEVPIADAKRLDELAAKPAKKKRSSRKAAAQAS